MNGTDTRTVIDQLLRLEDPLSITKGLVEGLVEVGGRYYRVEFYGTEVSLTNIGIASFIRDIRNEVSREIKNSRGLFVPVLDMPKNAFITKNTLVVFCYYNPDVLLLDGKSYSIPQGVVVDKPIPVVVLNRCEYNSFSNEIIITPTLTLTGDASNMEGLYKNYFTDELTRLYHYHALRESDCLPVIVKKISDGMMTIDKEVEAALNTINMESLGSSTPEGNKHVTLKPIQELSQQIIMQHKEEETW